MTETGDSGRLAPASPGPADPERAKTQGKACASAGSIESLREPGRRTGSRGSGFGI